MKILTVYVVIITPTTIKKQQLMAWVLVQESYKGENFMTIMVDDVRITKVSLSSGPWP